MLRFIMVLLALLVVVLPAAPSAQNDQTYIDQVFRLVDANQHVKEWLGSSQFGNFQRLTNGRFWGYIYKRATDGPTNSYVNIPVQFGYVYGVTVACDSDCTDVDLFAYEDNGNVLAKDDGVDDHPSFRLTSSRSQTVRVNVTIPARACSTPIGCYWAMQVVWK